MKHLIILGFGLLLAIWWYIGAPVVRAVNTLVGQ
jgi:hypothetical protein